MESTGPAYCSSFSGALTLLLRFTVALNTVLFVNFHQLLQTLEIPRLRCPYLLYFSLFWELCLTISLVAIVFIELASIMDCFATQLGGSLYRSRIAYFQLLAFPMMVIALVSIRIGNARIAEDPYRPFREPSITSIGLGIMLMPNLFIIFAMVLGGGFQALKMEARAMWETLKIAEIIGLRKEWAETENEQNH